ncbi:hypothetical protein Q8A73_013686 [Channa argus]|nr:hypothetical protein Q8A73_013686 [Channa argus]
MHRPGFVGASTSMSFSTRIMENRCSASDLTEEDLESLRIELAKIEEEIQTLQQVLLAKEKYATDIRRQLGMSPLSNIKQNLSKGWQDVQTSVPYLTASATLDDIKHSSIYVRTQESLSHAGHVTSSALSSMGVAITRRLADMSVTEFLPPDKRNNPLPSSSHRPRLSPQQHAPDCINIGGERVLKSVSAAVS